MLLGKIKFKCTACGHKFEGMAAEYRATRYVHPMPCPKCGSKHTRPAGLMGLLDTPVYKKIWSELDKE